jgi:hypothetical protein
MKRGDSILSSWHVLFDDASFSGLEFFERVEAAVKAREVPEASYSHKDFRDAGLLSDKRTYLRLRRNNLVFDIGAAPYGTGFYFSWWLVREGPRRAWAYLLGFVLVMLFVPLLVSRLFGDYGAVFYPILFVGTFVGLGLLVRSGTLGPDDNVRALPVLGAIYERLFSPATYYALDSVMMFRESVSRAVNEALDGMLMEQGLQALSEEQRKIEDRMLPS